MHLAGGTPDGRGKSARTVGKGAALGDGMGQGASGDSYANIERHGAKGRRLPGLPKLKGYSVLKAAETSRHLLREFVEILHDFLAALDRIFEFHATKLEHTIRQRLSDVRPRDLVFRVLCGLHNGPRLIVEGDDVLQHADCLVERTVSVKREKNICRYRLKLFSHVSFPIFLTADCANR